MKTHYPALIGDCPFNELQSNSDKIFEDFVFPISKNMTLIHNQKIDKNDFSIFLDSDNNVNTFLEAFSRARYLGTMHLSDRLVACCDKLYLEDIVNHYHKIQTSENYMNSQHSLVFIVLSNYKNICEALTTLQQT